MPVPLAAKTAVRMRKMLYHIFLNSVILLSTIRSHAQLVGTNAFLQGNYIRLGMTGNAAFGSTVPAPAGLLPTGADSRNAPICNLGKLGFAADVGRDGWTVGTPAFIGDYFLPGTPEEGWAVSFNGVNYNNNRSPSFIPPFTDACVGGTEINGTFTNFIDLPDKQVAIWEGTVNGLKIVKRITLPKDKLYFIIECTFYNITPVQINNLFYMRNVDPDNEVAQAGANAFTTMNTINYQNPVSANKALVSAKGTTYNSYLGLGTIDCRAKVCIRGGATTGQLANRVPAEVYNGVAPRLSALGATSLQDCAIALAFNLGNLPAGDSVRCAFAYILLQEDLEEALNKTAPHIEADGQTVINGGGAINCSGTNMQLNIVNGADYNWVWSPATGLNQTTGPIVTYTPQPVPVTYTVSGTDPICGSISLTITIYPRSQPLAQFSFNAPCGTKTTTFTNQSLTLTQPSTTYRWDFGDGQFSTLVSPTHTYTSFGSYDVKLTVITTALTCGSDTVVTKTVNVRDGAPAIIDNLNNACVGRSVSFNGSINIPPATITGYLWTISDGATYTTQNINHVFNAGGNFDVDFEVTTSQGCKSKVTKSISVETDPVVDFSVINGCQSKPLSITNNTSNATGAITQWNWSFGSQTSSLQNPVINFNNPGNFTIQLNAQTGNGCVGTFSQSVNIESIPVADFNYSTACPRIPVSFTNLSSIASGSIISYEWDFDNGNTSNQVNASTVFNSDRNYRVSLKAISLNGCESIVKTITIPIKSPYAYAGKDTLVFKDAPFRLRGKSGPVYVWSPSAFLDNPTIANPVATISSDQVFTVMVTDERGCTASDQVKIRVFLGDDIYVPSSFTPNNDGKNDVFRPIAPPGVVKLFEVYNRWGQKMYSSTDPQYGWNGKLESVHQPAGVYVWFLKAVTRKGESVQKKGTVMLMH